MTANREEQAIPHKKRRRRNDANPKDKEFYQELDHTDGQQPAKGTTPMHETEFFREPGISGKDSGSSK